MQHERRTETTLHCCGSCLFTEDTSFMYDASRGKDFLCASCFIQETTTLLSNAAADMCITESLGYRPASSQPGCRTGQKLVRNRSM